MSYLFFPPRIKQSTELVHNVYSVAHCFSKARPRKHFEGLISPEKSVEELFQSMDGMTKSNI